ncbi:MAG TPA: HWE histidine kinase domain-containing protein [Xanthobacteraceae bacterium]|nr:HWE histidine kinase domain-containing protein [Xanthobacteraceae bacterium]
MAKDDKSDEMVTPTPEGGGGGSAIFTAGESHELKSIGGKRRSTSEHLEQEHVEPEHVEPEHVEQENLELSENELQPVKEEPQTMGAEPKFTRDGLSRADSDLNNLVAATGIATVFLDSDLHIKRCTGCTAEVSGIAGADKGRSIADFADQLDYEDLAKDARAVITDLTPLRREVHSRAGPWLDMRMRPYRTVDGKADGLVIAFIDVTERHAADEARRRSEQTLRQDQRLLELSRDPIFIWDFDDGILLWNRGSEELYGYSREEAIGRRKDQLLATQVPGSSFAELRSKLLADGHYSGEVRHRTKDGRVLTIETRIVLETMGAKRLALESTRDVTERRQWEKHLQLLLRELSHRVRNTLSVVQAVAHQSLRTRTSSREFVERFDGRLAALASAHTLLVNSDWHGADLAALAESQLEAYRPDIMDHVRISGAPVTLPADLATPFGLILHELAINAARYGSLSVPAGSVDLSWSLDSTRDPPILKVVWQEQGGPPVKRRRSEGFGSVLIDRAISGSTVKREFHKTGLICTIELPLPAGS